MLLWEAGKEFLGNIPMAGDIDGSHISCYQWNGLLDAVRIFNEGKDFVLEDSGREVLCKSNELTTVTLQGMHTECENGIPAP